MLDIQSEIDARIEAFVSDITELAKQVAYEALASALYHGEQVDTGSWGQTRLPLDGARTRSGKRSADEIARTVEALEEYIQANPGQRMETIARAMGTTTRDLALPIKKLLATERVRTEGQKRATEYYPVSAEEVEEEEEAPRVKVRRRRRSRR